MPIKCYERRKKCLEARGWCYTENGEYGYCNEINELPDTPDPTHPLFEVQTFILPKEVNTNLFLICYKLATLNNWNIFILQDCQNAQFSNSPSRICTGHLSRGPPEYIIQVQFLKS